MWRERPVAPASPAPVYGWSRFACWVVIALAYEQAGLSKLRAGGLHWWNAQSVRAFIDRDVLVPARINWALSLHLTAAPDTLFSLLGAAGLAIELAFVLVLVSHTARRLLPAAVILMHVGIFLLQNVLSVDLFVLPLVFYDVTSIPASIGRALARARGRVQVLYDGWCPLCRGTVRTLALLDFFGRLEFLDFRRLDVAECGRRHALRLTIPELDEEMWVVARGQAYRGFAGYRLLAMVLPPAWPLAPWLFLPGISALATRLYRCVATNRFRPLLCDGQCGRRPVDGGTAASRDDPIVRGNPPRYRGDLRAYGRPHGAVGESRRVLPVHGVADVYGSAERPCRLLQAVRHR
jgi:predicted DCC family thiol-disulfide oxidoreductase YuxK